MENGGVYLKKGEGRSMKAGGPWVYDNEVERIEGEPLDGDVVSVHDYNGFCLGKGFLNRRSKLRVRMLTRNRNQEIDEDFLRMRVENAWEYRKKVVDTGSCRVIFGEADFLPGLVVDKFSDVLVVQSLALGMDRYKSFILETLKELMAKDGISIRGIYERSDAKVREQEGMPRVKGFLSDPFDTKVEIVENGVRYFVDVAEGQKTGFFLDQKYNRKAIWPLCPGAEVLDCFTHTGSFGLNCAKAGAKRVHSVDVSETAIACAKENAARNGLSVEYEVANVFDLLPSLTPGEYDYIILDPPAFTKSGKTVKNAERGYKEINYRAMKALPRGGYLATCSCSHFMTDALFRKMLQSAASDAQVELRLVEARAQGPDHPILWNVPETDYLKFYIFQVV